MHVHGVGVIDDVLPAADDVLPFRDQLPEQPDVVHRHQGAGHARLTLQDPCEDRGGLLRRTHRLVQQAQVLPDQTLGHPRQTDFVLLSDLEDAQDADRILS